MISLIHKQVLLLIFFILLCLPSPVISNQNPQRYIEPSRIIIFNDQDIETMTKGSDIIVYIAQQEWPTKSRIYTMNPDGSVIQYFEYDWYLFCDMEVVNNQLYVADWVAPCLYKMDIYTGILEQIVNDISLLYMYDVASDGEYFYLNEWRLNRYTINGTFDSSIIFDADLRGSTYDGTYYWTLDQSNIIKCYDISTWPTIIEIPENQLYPPSMQCKGLSFDGTFFYTAELIEGGIGNIYQFNYNGTVINQWDEPIYQGYSACKITTGSTNHTSISSLHPQWNFFSLPFNQTISTNDCIIHYQYFNYSWDSASTPGPNQLIDGNLFHWDRTNNTYQLTQDLDGGYGYWLFSYEPCIIFAENISIVDDPYITTLNMGWNAIGIPYTTYLNKTSILVNNSVWTDAINTGLIDDNVFGWNSTGQYYYLSNTFNPWSAYWMYAYTPCILNRSS